jgi:tetratricopeptide (TPR) repeat protein
MSLRLRTLLLVSLVAILGGTGCNRIRAKMAFKDGNKVYTQDKFKEAIPFYKNATELDPNMPEAWFYLGSSQQGLFRPGKTAPENLQHLDDAIASYEEALKVNEGSSQKDKQVKENTLEALAAIYSDEPKKDYTKATQYAKELVAQNETSSRNLFAMANLYEKFNKVDEAQQMYEKAWAADPEGKTPKEKLESQQKACGALAAFYNKPLWEGRSKFDQAIDILNKCADLNANDQKGYYKVATFYWDKAYRDADLNDKQKDAYADKGIEAVDHALRIDPQYADALAYKNLLYRVKGMATTNPKLRQEYFDQATLLQKQALELKKQQAETAAPLVASPSPK